MEVVVGAGVAQRALSGVGQRVEEFGPLRMPAGLRPGQGWPVMGSAQGGGLGKERHAGMSCSEGRS